MRATTTRLPHSILLVFEKAAPGDPARAYSYATREVKGRTPLLDRLRWTRRIRSAIVHTLALAQATLTVARGRAANRWNSILRYKTDNDRLLEEIALLREELRIKDARMARIPASRRPQYSPTERLAILELRAVRGWSATQTSDRLLVTPATIASWTQRLDEEGPAAIVRTPVPVNKFPELVAYIVRRLKVHCPRMGKVRIARLLCRAGLHLGSTTVRRMLRKPPPRRAPAAISRGVGRRVTAKRANQVWHADLTTVPTALGFWTPWCPNSLPLRWPFCWWVAIAVDHYSRRIMGVTAFKSQPSAADVDDFLGKTIRRAAARPEHLITDHGEQFVAGSFREWCRRRRIRQRFGTIGKYGSIAVVERRIRTLKAEGTRWILVPFNRDAFQRDLSIFARWYNAERPHNTLASRTPDEVYFGKLPACLAPRWEPRPRWPRRSPCAAPRVPIRSRPGVVLELRVKSLSGRKHLPLVTLRRAA